MDEYAYLREPASRYAKQYIEAENEYFHACMAPLSDFREALSKELRARIIEEDHSVPEILNGYAYYTRIEAGQQYPLHCRIPAAGGPEHIYLDENLLAKGKRYCEVSVLSISPNHGKYAFAVDFTGDERYRVMVGSFSGGDSTLCVERTAGDSLAWSANGRFLFHTRTDSNSRPDSVWSCDLVSGEQRVLYTEPDPSFHVSVWLSRSGRWVLIDTAGNTSSETWVLPADDPSAEPAVVVPRSEDVEYAVEPHEDRFLVLSNDQGENFRLFAVRPPPDTEQVADELIPPRQDVTLDFVDAYRHHLVIGERCCGVQNICVWDLIGGSKRYLPDAGELSCLDVEDLYDYDARFVRYEYSTPVKPRGVYDYDVPSGETTRRKFDIPPEYDEAGYTSERHKVPSDDVEVPLTLIYRNNLPEEGRAPVLFLAYGAYEESMDIEFDSDLVSLLDRGVVVAMAHVRGGGDLGPGWHDGGRLDRKNNSFKDFSACMKYMIDKRYTEAGRIAVWGASAGGLLAAVAVQRQAWLFASAVLEVPFVDVINSLLDRELPLTEHDFTEFGNPSVEEEFVWMTAYSPYDNIRPQRYPAMLVTAAMNDQRVGYWEALKYVARLRCNKTDDNPLLVKIDEVGHLGESGRYDAVNDVAIIYTFLLDAWGLVEPTN